MRRFVLLLTAIITLSSWGLLMGQVHDHEPGNQKNIPHITRKE